MPLKKKYHFIGIGGIGMSALARIALQKGFRVQGSDISSTSYTEKLKKEGAKIFSGHQAENIDAECEVVYNTLINEKNPEFQKAKELHLKILHRSDLLTEFSSESKTLYVAGTHGKTTTTSLLASVFLEGGSDPSFAIGGMLASLKTNAKWGKGEYFILEADESDGSFLKGKPYGAIITNAEKEHLDYWKSEEKMLQGFRDFFQKIENPHLTFWCKDDPILARLNPPGLSYGICKDASLRLLSFQQVGFQIRFTATFEGKKYEDLTLPLIGYHNVQNALGVLGLSLQLQIPEEAIRKAFSVFSGVGRRMEYLGKYNDVDFFDDYAHHPSEIVTTLAGLKKAAPQRRLVAVFQPHRFSRAQDFFHVFPLSFSSADFVIATDIHAAFEAPIPGIDGKSLYEEIKKHKDAAYIPKGDLQKTLFQYLQPNDLVITLGAGDITQLGRNLLKL